MPRPHLTIADVDLDSPAARAGLNRGDVLLKLDGQPVKDEEGMNEILRARSVGDTLASIFCVRTSR